MPKLSMRQFSAARPAVATAILSILLLALGAQQAQCGVIGYVVTGSLTFANTPSLNRFDPVNNSVALWVDPGALNAAGPTVTVQDPGTEFGVLGTFHFTADFADSQLTIRIVSDINDFGGWFTFAFTSDVPGLFESVNEISDDIPGGLTPSISGNTLWIGMAEYQYFSRNTIYEAVYRITNDLPPDSSVPEPSSLLLTGSLLLPWCIRRVRQLRSPRPNAAP